MKSANDCLASHKKKPVDTTLYNISVDNKTIKFQANDKSLLECLENANVEVHYHCRDGFCGACRVTLVEGDISYPQGEPLAFIGEGEVLSCCCVPKSDIKLIVE
ncbi:MULTISPECIES: class I ribonucleotide reductase maintenance protein YfaE [unclassified Colwellia]|uniref:class I ribonucleotide reductase maintenance protein YfaE n=1 Tax=unclassified Colwellia TaxID=196834 RepID=UPI0015F77BC3|nr:MULTISPECIES: class I ribonucleotide reductase maintenance protein YfaE [unclassified Colwellia]MBA6234098.1 2Fe-2S ferredoxin-like protein [Colwellia sp. MB02u-7]MBA6237980.1 2Fe-2S ferredoxin-like protein [Colwellia sp. MB02u-11]MBA6257707.1 2Fe-2S ferredoxin-like protein [Colwellia sp. MB3u-28]MBA6259464.1 2Fe-2S ferredoxin-like protein [Colwellia sp. MB3u-41]MBA6300772.1 2Fe-2S ferredoxin-like protein [Colwellia sp. MB3u-22]